MMWVAWFLHYKVSRVQRCRSRHVDVVAVRRINSKWKQTTKNLLHTGCTREFSALLCFRKRNSTWITRWWGEKAADFQPRAQHSPELRSSRRPHWFWWHVDCTHLLLCLHRRTRGWEEMVFSSQGRVSSPIWDTSMLSRRLTAEWKPTDVKFFRLGMAKGECGKEIQHIALPQPSAVRNELHQCKCLNNVLPRKENPLLTEGAREGGREGSICSTPGVPLLRKAVEKSYIWPLSAACPWSERPGKASSRLISQTWVTLQIWINGNTLTAIQFGVIWLCPHNKCLDLDKLKPVTRKHC